MDHRSCLTGLYDKHQLIVTGKGGKDEEREEGCVRGRKRERKER